MGDGFKIADGFVEVHGDTSKLDKDVDKSLAENRKKLSEEGKGGGEDFGKGVEEGSKEGLEGFKRDINGRLRDSRGRFVNEGKGSGKDFGDGVSLEGKKGLDRFTAMAQIAAGKINKTFDKDATEGVGKFLKKLNLLGGVMAGLKWSAMSIGAIAATNSILQLTSALAPAAGIVTGLPALISVAAASMITLKVATAGVGKAFGAALGTNASKFQAALKNLSPAAQKVAKDLHTLAPEFKKLKEGVQDAFFKPLVGQLSAVGHALLGPVKLGMQGLAAELGNGAKQVAEFAREGKTVDFISKAFAVAEASVHNLSSAIKPLLGGFRDMASAILPSMVGMSQSLANVATEFGNWMSKIAASGQAQQWFNSALSVFRQLFVVVKNLGGIIGSVFHAMQASGSSFLFTLGQTLQGFNVFLKSAEGAKDLQDIFKGIGDIAHVASGAIIDLIKAVAPALAALAPGLTAVAQGLKDAFGNPAFKQGLLDLGKAISTIASALAPLLPVIAELAGTLVSALAPAIKPLAGALQQVGLALGGALVQAIKALAPSIPPLAKAFADVVKALVPFISAIGPIAVAIAPLVTLVANLATKLTPLAPVIIGLIAAIKIWTAVQWLLNTALLSNPIGIVVVAITALVLAVIYAWNHFKGFRDFIIGTWGVIKTVFTTVLSAITSALVAAWNWISNATKATWNAIKSFFVGLWNGIKTVFSTVVGWIKSFVTSTWNGISSTTKAVWNAIKSFFTTLWNGIKSFITGAANGIKSALSSAWNAALGAARSAFNSIKSAVTGAISSVLGTVKSLPGKILGALSGLGSLLYNSGRAIIQGLVNGIMSMFGSVKNAVGNVLSAARNLLPFSPAKEGPFSGRGWTTYSGQAIVQGLAKGIADNAPMLKQVVGTLATNTQASIDSITASVSKAGGFAAGVAAGMGKSGGFTAAGTVAGTGASGGFAAGIAAGSGKAGGFGPAIMVAGVGKFGGFNQSKSKTVTASSSIGGRAGFAAGSGKGGGFSTVSHSELSINNLTIKLDATFDFSKGVPRDFTVKVRDALRSLEREYK